MRNKVSLLAVIVNSSDKVVGYRFIETASIKAEETGKKTTSNSIKMTSRTTDQKEAAVIKALISNPGCLDGIEYDASKKKLVGTACSLDRYPKVHLRRNGSVNYVETGVTVLYSIGDVGYRIATGDGTVLDVVSGDLHFDTIANALTNAKIVTRNGVKIVSAIKGTFDIMEPSESPHLHGANKAEKFVSDDKEVVLTSSENKLAEQGVNITGLREIREYNNDPRVPKSIQGTDLLVKNSSMRSQVSTDGSGMTIDEKMTYGLFALSNIRPFYYSVLNVMKRVETEDVPTMGVSVDTLYWNPKFVDQLSLGEIIFILMHEVGHITGKHSARQKNRDADIWNTACDLFINRALAIECGLNAAGETGLVQPDVSAKNSGKDRSYNVTLLASGLYNENVDIMKDTPESLYDELMEEFKNQGGFGKNNKLTNVSNEQKEAFDKIDSGHQKLKDGIKNNDSAQAKQGLNEIKDGIKDLKEINDKNKLTKGEALKNAASQVNHGGRNVTSGMKNDRQSQVDSGEKQVSSAIEDLRDRYSNSGQAYDGTQTSGTVEYAPNGTPMHGTGQNMGQNQNNKSGHGQNQNNNSGQFKDGSGKQQGAGGNRMNDRTFRGKKISGNSGDLIDDPRSKNMSDREKDQAGNALLSSAVQQHRQAGYSFGGEAGTFMEREAALAMAPKVDWRRLVRQYANKKSNLKEVDHKSYKRKDVSRSRVFTGRSDSTFNIPRAGTKKPECTIEGLKICVDTSGSICDTDIGIMFGQVLQLANLGKTGKKIEVKKPEVIYWDTQVRANYPLNKPDEVLRARPYGGGGTDANCVFEYFDTCKNYKNGRVDKPELVLIFTDGYIPDVDMKYAHKKYNVIWIITKNGDVNFVPPFGIKANFNN